VPDVLWTVCAITRPTDDLPLGGFCLSLQYAWFMDKPTSIKIFGIKYKIKYDHKSPSSYGMTDSGINTIHLRPNLNEDKMIQELHKQLN
jgi:hypothetical protein